MESALILMTSPKDLLESALIRASAIRQAFIDIYEPLLPYRAELFYPDDELSALFSASIVDEVLSGPIRSRSKSAKQMVSRAMGYEPPASFRKERPRFPGQDLDVYVQVSDNLQIWNQEVYPERRYVLIRPGEDGKVEAVRVVRGKQLAHWDTTGTLTSKFQASRDRGHRGSKLVSPNDTAHFAGVLQPSAVPKTALASQGSGNAPKPGSVLPIAEMYKRLLPLIGLRLPPTGAEQDRARGESLQEAVCKELGLGEYKNHGQWPDIVSQALEVKLQTSRTIDLGLVLPTDESAAPDLHPKLRHCDARYLIAYGDLDDVGAATITAIVVATGEDFFQEFTQFGGLVKNTKRQIRLPSRLFES